MRRIDSHIHYSGDHADDLAVMEKLNVKFLCVCVAHDANDWLDQADTFSSLAGNNPEAYAWCTSFDPVGFEAPDYIDKVLARIDRDVANGAVACKAWKNIGMEIKKSSGEFIMIDDPVFDPIYEHLTKIDLTLLGHLGEPLQCWLPLDPENPHFGYYTNNPKWHLHGKPEFPSHQAIIDARDHVMEKHPKLRFVGAHIGSQEYDVAEVARRFERYPNFAIDTSARTMDLAIQDTSTVRQWFQDFPDRILFGTDVVNRKPLSSELSTDERKARLDSLEARFRQEFDFYESKATVTFRNREVQGLGLSDDILDKFYCTNARNWYPGI